MAVLSLMNCFREIELFTMGELLLRRIPNAVLYCAEASCKNKKPASTLTAIIAFFFMVLHICPMRTNMVPVKSKRNAKIIFNRKERKVMRKDRKDSLRSLRVFTLRT